MSMEKRVIPAFKTEAEEAQWWFDHRDEIAADVLAAVREGRTSLSSPNKRVQRLEEIARAKAGNENLTPVR